MCPRLRPLRPLRWLQRGLIVASLAAAPAWAVGADERTGEPCGGIASHLQGTGIACQDAQFQRLDARLQELHGQHGRNSTSDAARAADLADHIRWQRAAMAFCAGVATTEPLPTYAAALLDCAVSVLQDRVATLEDRQHSIALPAEEPRALVFTPQPDHRTQPPARR